MTSPAGTLKTTQKKRLAWEDVAKQVGLQTGMYCSSEYSFICLMFSFIVRIMLLHGCSFLVFFSVWVLITVAFLCLLRGYLRKKKQKNKATFGEMRDGS